MRLKKWFVILGAVGLATVPLAAHASSHADSANGQRGWLAAATSIDLWSPSNKALTRTVAHGSKQFQQPTNTRVPGSDHALVGSFPTSQSSAPLLTQTASFPLISEAIATAALGNDQLLEPPDTMLAAGPTSLLETINSNASLWTKTGTRTALVDLNKALPMPAGDVLSDPRILFDVASGRWFFSGVAFSPATFNSVVILGVSKTSDPTGGFFFYQVAANTFGEIHDQPKIGVNSDKVVISWNEFCCGVFGTFRGAETFVIEKATLLTGGVTRVFFVGPNLTQSSPVPTQSLNATTTEYVTFNGGAFTGVLSITGTPAANNVVITETHLAMAATSLPPRAMQPGGTIATNDDRFLSSISQNGVLWVSGNTGCMPSGSASIRACLRLVKVSTSGTPSLLQAFDLGTNGFDAYFPAVTMDAAGDLFASLSVSSSSTFGSAAAIAIAAGSPAGTISGAAVFQLGAQKYNGTRWGDYSAISVDPATGKIWAAAEYAATRSFFGWGTAAAEFSLP